MLNAETGSKHRTWWFWIFTLLFVLLFELFLPRIQEYDRAENSSSPEDSSRIPKAGLRGGRWQRNTMSVPPQTATEVVAAKLANFARSRRDLAHALASRHNLVVSEDVDKFFDAVESDVWEDIEAALKKISGQDTSAGQNGNRPPGINELWPAIIDAYGVAEQVHLWPAQKLLDYGNSILDSLAPGAVYVGGSDHGRWIPELLNDTRDGDRHVIITQNGLADGAYQDYLRLQYGDKITNLSREDAERTFSEYTTDALKRRHHDIEFPDEPKLLLSNEKVGLEEGKVVVGGQVAVMAINEQLLQTLLRNNPTLSFSLEESIPMKSTYADALPRGPLMELRSADETNQFSNERAAQSLDYWKSTIQNVLNDPEAMKSTTVVASYSHDATGTANLLAAHNFTTEAEQGYRLAITLSPDNPGAVGGLVNLLAKNGRENEAMQLLADFKRKYPSKMEDLQNVGENYKLILSAPVKTP